MAFVLNAIVECTIVSRPSSKMLLFYFRTIHVYDTDKETFREFLKFIYTAHLEVESKSLENLLELIALSDQYEVKTQFFFKYNFKPVHLQQSCIHFLRSE